MTNFQKINSGVSFDDLEKKQLEYWQNENIFFRSIDNRRGNERFVFYEGPPTANGEPHMGHVEQRALKDLILRYKTMKGYLVERRAGWDTHGLPVELEIEKKLGLKGKPDILKLKDSEFESIKYFNQLCKESVFEYVDIWKNLTERVGFWIDFENAYVTYDNNYIESVWWFISQMQEKGLLYKDYKVVPYCPRCGTSLSSHELAQGYKDDVEDPSVIVKFELVEEPGTYVLVWTTTPWTLPGNVALAVGPKIEYVKVRQNGQKYILAKKRLEVLGDDYEEIGNVLASELVGKSYIPLFPYMEGEKKAYFIGEADFATDEDGTGIVHTAVMYGADDFEFGKKMNLPMKHLVDLKGTFIDEVKQFSGLFVKKADPKVIEDLESRGLMYKSSTIKHTYPFCWRCGTPILYYALDSWFIKTTAVKEKLLTDNSQVNWVPKSIQDGRMKNWLETLIDWNISRNRFWGTPMPVWQCENGHIKVIGSREELTKLSGQTIDDLHRPFIDEVTFECAECKQKMTRLPDVMDVWMDSGAMPFAQWHYPFEHEKEFKEWYPADYIVEGIDQTRGWFFTLMAEAMLLGEETPAPFKNVVATGFVLDDKGQKMSKSKGNGISPMEIIPVAGADTLRWYIYSADPTGNILFSRELVAEKQRKFTLILWNCYKFFLDYATVNGWQCEMERGEMKLIDKWVLAKLTQLVQSVNKALDEYRVADAARVIESYVSEDLSTWYIRLNRNRVSQDVDLVDRNLVMSILFGNLVTLSKLMAPFTPFLSEEIYRNLTGGDVSVHLQDYPMGDSELLDDKLVKGMEVVRDVVEKGHRARQEAGIKLRQPLASATYFGVEKLSDDLSEIVREELNVKTLNFGEGEEFRVELDTDIDDGLRAEGDARELIRQIQILRKEAGLSLKDEVEVIEAPEWPEEFEKEILSKVSAKKITKGEELKIVV